ncbi:hypothetical protein AM587_10014523 [Phytophthora nicotianae]|uniref:Uncharacterized protein n=1 Tax=Phytophthora nicotianae TaxID=4792 RepID=A0A0W8BN12_PHYNI|nr:hypothetical protein AM587_10014523 [Phytophthora nicotianae]
MAGETKSLSGMQRRAAGRRIFVADVGVIVFSNRAHNRMVIQKLVVFSILMVVVPLTTFYGVRSLFRPVNIVIGLYILSAWKEDDGKEMTPPVGRFAKAKEQ